MLLLKLFIKKHTSFTKALHLALANSNELTSQGYTLVNSDTFIINGCLSVSYIKPSVLQDLEVKELKDKWLSSYMEELESVKNSLVNDLTLEIKREKEAELEANLASEKQALQNEIRALFS